MTDKPRETAAFLKLSREGREWAGLASGCLSKPVVILVILIILLGLGVKFDALERLADLLP